MCTFKSRIWTTLGYGMCIDMFVTESEFPKTSGHTSMFVPEETCPCISLTVSYLRSTEDPV